MRHRTLIATLAGATLLLGLARVAAAQESLTPVDQLLGDGWRYYSEELDFERALAAYEEASVHPDANDDQLMEAFEYLAACRFALGNQEGAREALSQLLHIDPNHSLSDPSHSPDFLQMLDDLRAEAPPLPPEPADASQAPADTEVPPTFHTGETGQAGDDGEGRPPRTRRPVARTWWFWTIIGVVVVGGVTAGIVAGTSGDEVAEPPQGALDPGVVQLPCTIRF